MAHSVPTLEAGLRLHQAGKFHQAGQIYQQILQQNPHDANAMHLLGVVAFQQSRFADSARLIERAIGLDPYQYAPYHNLGSTYRVLGRFDDARAHYRKSIELKPDYAEAYFNLSAIHRFAPGDPLIPQLEQQLQQENLTDADRCFLHFSAGKAYDECQQYDLAFPHFERGNRAAHIEFSADDLERFVDEMLKVVDQPFFSANQEHGHLDDCPILIVGMPRSGTTLVEQILSSHPAAHGAGELPDITGITSALTQHATDRASYPQSLRTIGPHVFKGFGQAYTTRLRQLAPDAQRVIDKNPVNHQHLGLIMLLLPQARIIHCRRHALDTSLSCYFQKFRSGQEFSYSFEGIAAYYHSYVRLMDHWNKLAGERILDLSYEDLVDDIDTVARQVLDFCGLPWHPSCLDFHRSARPVATASDIQVRQPLYKNRVARWRNYEAFIGPLRELLALD